MTPDVDEPEWLRQSRSLSTAEVSDALDFFGLPGSAMGIQSMSGRRKLFGLAFTIRFAPIDRFQPGTVGDFLDRLSPGCVVVLDNAGRMDCTVWGGILSQLAAHKGIGGTVVNGVCRDTAEAEDAHYPLFALGKFMRTGKDRIQVEAYEQPVMLGDVRVCPGDLLIGDDDGVVVVPHQRMRQVLTKALETRAVEAQILDAALDGMALAEARKKFGYHTLQRSPTALTG
ncbi:diguanylate cyclase [Hydrogenophaga sp. Root209]|uniref:RraA family protein n=1 Tax=Hydrogenophaga sp. Root209 TaxID=1736490 RepID=UPI0006F96F80|nr:diguanylate cyclase [Hydrogenophaga sp. Root209]KRC04559.1 diguanylate cyclase [Hydrogenophaga sp. Root209]